jgi:exo-beta-1,3-glucanase (GH17 family)
VLGFPGDPLAFLLTAEGWIMPPVDSTAIGLALLLVACTVVACDGPEPVTSEQRVAPVVVSPRSVRLLSLGDALRLPVSAHSAGDAAPTANVDAVRDTARQHVRVRYPVFGVGFGPFVDGQDPTRGATVSETQLRERMRLIQPYTQWIRTFGSTAGLEAAGRVARELGLKVACSAWLARDAAANEREIASLIAALQRNECDLAIVGSEVLLRGDLPDTLLVQHLERVRQHAAGVPVTTADVYDRFWRHPTVVDAVDVVFANYYPFWEGLPLDQAVGYLHGLHQATVSLAGGKPVYVSETGWPSCGSPRGAAVPSPANAAHYFLNVVSWARANDVPYFYFQALDEAWKAQYEGDLGACWGLLDKDGRLKPGMEAVFEGRTLPDNWTTAIPGGPGEPTIEFTYLPPYGSTEDLRGRVLHVLPSGVGVAVYIKVRGRWWTKPYFDQPVTRPRPDGAWITDITTGGVDREATEITAFLIPAAYDPPLAGGSAALPSELDQRALARVTATRP